MKTIQKLSTLSLVWLLIIIFHAQAAEIKFDGGEAKKYASKYCGAKDSGTTYNFKDYKCYNGKLSACENHPSKVVDRDKNSNPIYGNGRETDCANFVSQNKKGDGSIY